MGFNQRISSSTFFYLGVDSDDPSTKRRTKSIVNRVLQNVMRTGFFHGRLQVWDMSSSGGDFGTNGRKVEAAWSSMVKDSESCATFAVMTDICVDLNTQHDQSYLLPANFSGFLTNSTKKIFYTRLCINIHRSSNSGHRSEVNPLKSSAHDNMGNGSGHDYCLESTKSAVSVTVENEKRSKLGQSNVNHLSGQESSSSSPVANSDGGVMLKRYANLSQGYSSVGLNEGLERIRARMQDRFPRGEPPHQPSRVPRESLSQPATARPRSIQSTQAVSPALNHKIVPRGGHDAATFGSSPYGQSSFVRSGRFLMMSGRRLRFYNGKGRCLGILHLQLGQQDSQINLNEVSEHGVVQAKWEPVNQWKSKLMSVQTQFDEFDEKLEGRLLKD